MSRSTKFAPTNWVLPVVLSLSAGASSQSAFKDTNWQGMGGPVTISVIAGFVLALVIIFLYYGYNRLREDHHLAAAIEKRFAEACARVDLTDVESKKMRALAALDPQVQPQVIFQAVAVFEKCLHAEVEAIIGRTSEVAVWQKEEELFSAIRKKCGFSHLPLEHPLVTTRNIVIGQRGSVFGSNFKIPIIQKAIVRQTGEFGFELHYDAAAEDVGRLTPGEEVKFVFSRQNDGLYGVPIRIRRAEGDGIIHAFHSANMRRNQLRQFVRIDVNLPMKLRLVKTADPASSQVPPGETYDVRMADISGGGLSFLSERSLRPGDIISASFCLPDSTFATVTCKVLRISLQEGKTKTHYRHHAQFTNLEPARRDGIVRFVFEKLRLLSQWS
jgi:uncharacterized membrane protein